MVAANGQPIDAHTHILNNRVYRGRNNIDDNYAVTQIMGARAHSPGPRDIEKNDTSLDPVVCIDSYTMAMGIIGHSELLVARYLPLMMDRENRRWFNTLPLNSIDSWEEARTAFVQYFTNAYTRATTIEDLDRCIQGLRELTRRWVQRWQDLWTTSTGISTGTAIYCFRRCCRYEPLIAKLKRISRDPITMAELMDTAQHYSEKLSGAKFNYPVYDKELYALIRVLEVRRGSKHRTRRRGAAGREADMELDMKLDMKTSHGRAREEREAYAREEEVVQAGATPGPTGRHVGRPSHRPGPTGPHAG
ncbi:hypothetical protein QYE76_066791 [Lolium multiflorum]|uniref:Retrotransposon gag domain-containing protein n=1 Tax=Lolium multiflorum TaxID=4521 RepID=A0AAD8SCT9_LOLMU|nr:hypothetical protein QYE76_066791 [Lolium multiflorum]